MTRKLVGDLDRLCSPNHENNGPIRDTDFAKDKFPYMSLNLFMIRLIRELHFQALLLPVVVGKFGINL